MTRHYIEFSRTVDTAPMLAAFLNDVRGFCIGRGVHFADVYITAHMGPGFRAARATLYREVLADGSEVYNVRLTG